MPMWVLSYRNENDQTYTLLLLLLMKEILTMKLLHYNFQT